MHLPAGNAGKKSDTADSTDERNICVAAIRRSSPCHPFNFYAYVGNDPVNFIDPTGLDRCFNTYRITVNEDTGEVVSRQFLYTWCIPTGAAGAVGRTQAGDVLLPPQEAEEVVVRRPRPPQDWWRLLRRSPWLTGPTAFLVAYTWQTPWTQEERCQDAPYDPGCPGPRASQGSSQPPYLTPIDPERLRAHEQCSAMCRDIFVRNPNALPGVGRNYQQRMGQCVRACMEDQGYTPF
jgi:hypothetical protein